MNVTRKQVLRYTLLPGFIPRILDLFRSGFYHVAYLLGVIFHIVRLLPSSHPYLLPQNVGRFGIRHVIAEAYANLEFRRDNIDQIIVFFAVSSGLALLFLQFFILLTTIVSGQAMADSAYELTPWTNWFGGGPYGGAGGTISSQDMALMTLDRVFGVKGIFDSCVSTGVACVSYNDEPIPAMDAYPSPFHTALHAMFEFYSYGMVVIAVIIICYFTVALVAESAVTGAPFGQRYTKAWVPIRLILFFALLTPLNLGGVNAGLNSGQIITLWVAKFGSNFATNGWNYFGKRVSDEYAGDVKKLIAKPGVPQIGSLAQFVFVAKACAMGKSLRHNVDIKPYVVTPFGLFYDETSGVTTTTPSSMEMTGSVGPPSGQPFSDALAQSKNGSVIIRFGEKDADKYPIDLGNVSPECGQITLTVNDVNEPGSIKVQEGYYSFIKQMWLDHELNNIAKCWSHRALPYDQDSCPEWPDAGNLLSITRNYENMIETLVDQGIQEQIDNAKWSVTDTMKQKGWAAAAVWYTRIAQMNGAVTTSIFNVPRPDKWPRVMEEVLSAKRANNAVVGGENKFSPAFKNGGQAQLQGGSDDIILATALNAAYTGWSEGSAQDGHTVRSGNVMIDTINAIFGTAGLMTIRDNTDVHPMAVISSLGRGLIEATIRNVLIGSGLRVGKSLANIIFEVDISALKVASDFLFTVAMSIVVIGVIMFYVVPLLPFIYFIFAVSGWIKSIFEAIVAMPLWALAHILRIDGQGLPGPAATNGYFLLMEIAIRPILIVIGLIASMSVFAALVTVLNDVFDLVVDNVAGYGDTSGAGVTDIEFYRAPLDQLMFTVMYAAIVYIIGLSCFKLIDHIPNQILRWINVSASTFQENAGDPAGDLTSTVYRAGTIMTTTARQGGGQLAVFLS